MKNKTELSIGIFVFVALVALVVMIIGFGDYRYSGRRYVVYALFNYVSGIVEGAPVRYAGVDVGKVSSASVIEASDGITRVRIGLKINEDVKIKRDSMAFINSLGIIGEKYVEIFPGSAGSPALNVGDEIQGSDPVALEVVMSNAQKVLQGLDNAITAVNNILAEDTQQDIKITVSNFKDFSADIDTLTKTTQVIMDHINKGEGTLGMLIYQRDLYDEFLALIKGIRQHGIFYKSKEARKDMKRGEATQQFGPRK